jgi:hypothetical protein
MHEVLALAHKMICPACIHTLDTTYLHTLEVVTYILLPADLHEEKHFAHLVDKGTTL